VFKPSEDAESLLVSIFKKLGSFGFEFFVGYVLIRVGLGLFGPLHLALRLNRKRKLRVSFFYKKLGEHPQL